MLGNNYGGDADAFAAELGGAARRARPGPVVLVSVTRFRPVQDQVNYVLHRAGRAARPTSGVVDWQARRADDDGELLGGDGLHLTERPGGAGDARR